MLKGGINDLKLKIRNSEQIKEFIALKGKTISSFSKEIKSNPAYIKDIVIGKVKPGPPLAKKISDGLGVNVSDIFLLIALTNG